MKPPFMFRCSSADTTWDEFYSFSSLELFTTVLDLLIEIKTALGLELVVTNIQRRAPARWGTKWTYMGDAAYDGTEAMNDKTEKLCALIWNGIEIRMAGDDEDF